MLGTYSLLPYFRLLCVFFKYAHVTQTDVRHGKVKVKVNVKVKVRVKV